VKALNAVGATLEDFAAIAQGRQGHAAPVIGFAKAGNDGYFDDEGYPVGDRWDEVRFPGLETENVYALEITGDSMEPVYRKGDRIVVAPGVPVRRGDRVVARTKDGEVLAKVLGKNSERVVELLSLNPDYPPREMPRSDLAWMARILWASQ
jgi:phage repressor protein C with HTH and peptisase S24 domain